MSEPGANANSIQQLAPTVWRWHVLDDRIDYESDAYAVRGEDGVIMIDPLPLRPKLLRDLGRVEAICLTAACHQRSAWRYRREFGAVVYAPKGCRDMEEEADQSYAAGDLLPGRLRAIHTPGPEAAHYAFLQEQEPKVLFSADLMMRDGDGALEFVPPGLHDDPEATRASVRGFLGLDFSILCLSHGPPVTSDAHGALRALFEETGC